MKKKYNNIGGKKLLMINSILFSSLVLCQVGVGTPTPRGAMDINKPTTNTMGLVLPTNANVNNIINPQGGTLAPGTIIYDSSLDCVRVFKSTNTWSGCISDSGSLQNGSITSLDCANAINSGTLTDGTVASGVSSQISYTGGNGGAYMAQSVTSTGVTGLTANLSAGSFANGPGTVTYSITGTPSGSGTASFSITLGGQSCTFMRMVSSNVSIPASITLASNQKYFVPSIYDQDYLPYTDPTGPANISVVNADGVNEATPVNIQGTITTAGVNVLIPVTVTGSGTLPAYSQTITIPAFLTEDGIARSLNLSWGSQAYTGTTTTVSATIKALGGTLNVKKLDLNAGLGNDYLGVLLGEFLYPYNNSGSQTSYQVRIIPGIPDRMFGKTDNNGSITHNLLYMPVQGEDGNIWLNNNLGADYNKINGANFNPAKQAIIYNDYLAYGSFFQWGRKGDGHELMNWTGNAAGSSVYTTSITNSDSPTYPYFIMDPNLPYDWRVNQDSNLWALEISPNNVCPAGFRIPTMTEWDTLRIKASITNRITAAASVLKLPAAGVRGYDNGLFYTLGSNGRYWSNAPNGNNSQEFSFSSGTVSSLGSNTYRAGGLSVRCIKN